MMKLSEIKLPLEAQLVGSDVTFTGVSTDTRTIKPGELFVAIQGESFDGHDFIKTAEENGAAAVVIQNDLENLNVSIPCLRVKDTTKALGQLAHHYRKKFNIPVIGITGSCGKTTTKTFIQSILSKKGKVLAAKDSYNNHIGVPLTLLRLQASDDYAVIEIGANHQHEIEYLTKIAKPTHAVVTNVAPVHLEGFGSIEGVAKTKGELYQELESNACAIVNKDESFANSWGPLLKDKKVSTFSVSDKTSDVWADAIESVNGCSKYWLNKYSTFSPKNP